MKYHAHMGNPDYLQPYVESQRQHGSGFDVTLWASEKTQRRRFEVMAEMTYLQDKVILDAGCSRGDFAAFLNERRIAYRQYIGVDALPEVIEFAASRELPNTQFAEVDLIREGNRLRQYRAQVVCLSGTLNTMTMPDVLATLDNCWQAAGQCFLFNFLPDTAGSGAPRQTHPARRLSTYELLTWAFRQTPIVSYRQDYLPDGHDGTVMMQRLR